MPRSNPATTRARALVADVVSFETMRAKHNNGANVTVVKEAMAAMGFQMGPVRLPGLPQLDPPDRATLMDVLGKWGVLKGSAA